MNIIKQLRCSSGYTQSDLVEISGLSLRTIQRLEAGTSIPKGYTLKMLALAFKVDASFILSAYQDTYSEGEVEDPVKTAPLLWINLSILAFIGIPFGNLIVPFFVWKNYRNNQIVSDIGASIISIQILWSVLLAISLSVAPFVRTSFSLILVVLFIMMVANIIWVFYSAYEIGRDRFEVFDIPVRLIR